MQNESGDVVSKLDKLKQRLRELPKDFTYDELVSLLTALGYELDNKGKTSGSRVRFMKGTSIIILHKPHPGNIMKTYSLKQVIDVLESEGQI